MCGHRLLVGPGVFAHPNSLPVHMPSINMSNPPTDLQNQTFTCYLRYFNMSEAVFSSHILPDLELCLRCSK